MRSRERHHPRPPPSSLPGGIRIRANAPSTPRGLAAKDFARDPEQAPEDSVVARALSELAHGDAVGADFVSYRVDHLPTPQTTLRRAEGRPVLCWTVRSPETEREARRHADNITFEGYRP